MQDIKLFWPKIKPAIPHLYFVIAILMMSYPSPGYITIFLLPFLLQIFYQKKAGNMLLGILMLFISIWLCLALLSEITKMIEKFGGINNYSILMVGIPLVTLNLIMSVWLMIKGSRQVDPDPDNTLAAA